MTDLADFLLAQIAEDGGRVTCDFCWGSHGCDRPAGHDGPHECGTPLEPCSQFDEQEAVARYWIDDARWGKWWPNAHGFFCGKETSNGGS